VHVVERLRQRLGRQRVHEIEIEVVDSSLPQLADGTHDVTLPMDASEQAKLLLVERLCAQRHAIDASVAITGEAAVLDRARIGFQRDFDIGSELDLTSHALQQPPDLLWSEQARRAAAKKNRRQWSPLHR
jgi:hypothetical protein